MHPQQARHLRTLASCRLRTSSDLQQDNFQRLCRVVDVRCGSTIARERQFCRTPETLFSDYLKGNFIWICLETDIKQGLVRLKIKVNTGKGGI